MTIETVGGNDGKSAKCRRIEKQRTTVPRMASRRYSLPLPICRWIWVAFTGFAFAMLVARPELLTAQISRIATTKKSFQQDDTFRPLTGKKLQEKLKGRVSANWLSARFRPTLARLSANQRVAIFVDRRVDPGLLVNFSAERIAVGELIYQFAEMANCGVCWLGDVAYVGPEQDVAKLIILRQRLMRDIDGLSKAERRKWLTPGKFECRRLQQPQMLWSATVSGAGLQTEDQLPHDLMPAYSFPALRAVDRLILLCFGFNRWLQRNNNRIQLVDVPEIVSADCSLNIGSALRQTVFDKLTQEFPDADLKISRNRLSWTADSLTSYRIRRTAMGLEFSDGEVSGGADQGGTSVYSFSSTVSIEQVLRTAAAKLNVELEYDASLRDLMIRRIELNVTQVTLEELIVAALDGTGLVHVLRNGKLIVRQKRPSPR